MEMEEAAVVSLGFLQLSKEGEMRHLVWEVDSWEELETYVFF